MKTRCVVLLWFNNYKENNFKIFLFEFYLIMNIRKTLFHVRNPKNVDCWAQGYNDFVCKGKM